MTQEISLKFDEKGLIPAIVQDVETGPRADVGLYEPGIPANFVREGTDVFLVAFA